MSKGKFIVLEGIEGAGKSKQSRILTDTLVNRGVDAVCTREPGGAPLGEALRSLILSPDYDPDAISELYMYLAARRDHLLHVILPAVEQGKTVICDRFTYSTVAYQGYGRGLDIDFVRRANAMTIAPLEIDLGILIDITPEEGFARKGGADKSDRLERENAEFFERVYKGFKTMADAGELVAIDGSGTKEQTAEKILSEVLRIL